MEVEDSVFHVLLEGSRVGPYDRRTIIGMRIKKALTSEHVLIGTDGKQLTVGDLIGTRAPDAFNASRTSVFSVVRATFTAALVSADRGPLAIPAFKGEMEARVQADVLRLAGRFRRGFGWKEDRVKVPLADVVHAQVRGSVVDLWLGRAGQRLQRLSLELFSPGAAGDFVEWFPGVTPHPESSAPRTATPASHHGLWIAIAATSLVVLLMLVVLLWPRVR